LEISLIICFFGICKWLHKVEIRPNQEQEEYLLGAVGSRRFAYNHLVAYYNEHKKLTKTISTNLIKELRSKY